MKIKIERVWGEDITMYGFKEYGNNDCFGSFSVIELNVIEDLIELQKKVGHSLIFDETLGMDEDKYKYTIKIYDDYIE